MKKLKKTSYLGLRNHMRRVNLLLVSPQLTTSFISENGVRKKGKPLKSPC